MSRLSNVHILMYSHDTFGLGHLRRCRAVAHSLVEHFKGVRILIITGSQIAGAFNFSARVDFVKIPSVIKLYNGEYTSIDKHIDLTETMQMRSSIIQHTAESFEPDIMIVDKEPLGLRGEMVGPLKFLKEQGTRTILGLRDVMDSPDLLRREWDGNGTLQQLNDLYNDVWVYGPKSFWDPLTGLDAGDAFKSKVRWLGFLRRAKSRSTISLRQPKKPYLLVTGGGGGDGGRLMRQVLDAYAARGDVLPNALLVLGPLMPSDERAAIFAACDKIKKVDAIEFDNNLEALIDGASGIVGMCGYNTFCEILSFDKPALVVPRVRPREEQLIRARRAEELGLMDMLLPDDADDAAELARLMRDLAARTRPSSAGGEAMLNGLESIHADITEWAGSRPSADLYSLATGPAQ